MAKTLRLSLRGSPPFSIITEHLASDDEFIADAKRIISIPDEKFELLATALETSDSFLDRRTLRDIVTSVLGETEDAKEIARTIWRLASMLRDADEDLQKATEILKTNVVEKLESFSHSDRTILAKRLTSLASRPSGFDRQHKAQTLAEATGKELEKCQMICDMRPVFDDDRNEVLGAIPIITFHLDFSDGGSDESIEARISERQLYEIRDVIENAIKKLISIKSLLESKDIQLPKTTATEVAVKQ